MTSRSPRSARCLVAAGALVAAATLTTRARAQCTKDTDCKGSRVCIQGNCVESPASVPATGATSTPAPAPATDTTLPLVPQAVPAAPAVTQPTAAPTTPPGYVPPYYPYYPPPGYPPPGGYPPAPAYASPGYVAPPPLALPPAGQSLPHASPGWAKGAAVYGIVAGAVALGLTIGAENTKSHTYPAAPLGGAATGLFALSLPIVAIGGASARDNPLVVGSPGLRIWGWIGYGLAIADAAYLLSYVGKREPADGAILSVGLGGATSLTLFIIDAFMSASQAEALADYEAGRAPRATRARWTPWFVRDPAAPQRILTGVAWTMAM
jgi:hypothetical protein